MERRLPGCLPPVCFRPFAQRVASARPVCLRRGSTAEPRPVGRPLDELVLHTTPRPVQSSAATQGTPQGRHVRSDAGSQIPQVSGGGAVRLCLRLAPGTGSASGLLVPGTDWVRASFPLDASSSLGRRSFPPPLPVPLNPQEAQGREKQKWGVGGRKLSACHRWF